MALAEVSIHVRTPCSAYPFENLASITIPRRESDHCYYLTRDTFYSSSGDSSASLDSSFSGSGMTTLLRYVTCKASMSWQPTQETQKRSELFNDEERIYISLHGCPGISMQVLRTEWMAWAARWAETTCIYHRPSHVMSTELRKTRSALRSVDPHTRWIRTTEMLPDRKKAAVETKVRTGA